MGSDLEFGPDTESIRAWLAKRATYANDTRFAGTPRGGALPAAASPPAPDAPSEGIASRHRSAAPDSVDVARSVLDALRTQPERSGPEGREPERPEPSEPSEPAQRAPQAADAGDAGAPPPIPAPPRPSARATVRVGRWTEPLDNLTATEATTDVDFPPRTGVRRLLSLLLLVVLAATGAASYAAWQQPTTATIGVAVIVGVVLLVVWGVRASTTTTHLSIHRGQLTVQRDGRTEVVDLTSPYTPIAMVGEPGQRRWRVLVERPDLPLIVVTPAMVDPHWFSTALYRLRPELRSQAVAIQ